MESFSGGAGDAPPGTRYSGGSSDLDYGGSSQMTDRSSRDSVLSLADVIPVRELCDYQANYCEENVYLLCERAAQLSGSSTYAVFVSNDAKKVPLWCQKAGDETKRDGSVLNGLVVWDYHVFMLAQQSPWLGTVIYDLDSTLPFPCNALEYSQHALKTDAIFGRDFPRLFRVVPTLDLLPHFTSDRRHMKKPDGSWSAPPPTWDPLGGEKRHNLNHYIDMSVCSPAPGNILDLKQFCDFVTRSSCSSAG